MVGTGLAGIQSMLTFNFEDTKIDVNSTSDMVKRKQRWEIGRGAADPRPTKLGIINLSDVMTSKFWTTSCNAATDPAEQECCRRIPSLHRNLPKALDEYADSKGIQAPNGRLVSGIQGRGAIQISQGCDFSGFIRNSGFLSRPKTIF